MALPEIIPDDSVESALGQAGEPQIVPASGFQREIFHLAQGDLQGCSPAFNESVSIALQGPGFSVSAMREAINELVNRHEVLRSRMSADGTQLLVHQSASLHVPAADLSTISEALRIEELAKLLKDRFAAPFDLRRGPIFRAEIVRMSSELHVVVLTSHLAICDGWSIDVLVSDLGMLYSRRNSTFPRQSKLPSVERYADYANERELFAASEDYHRIDTYWRSVLSGPPDALGLPATGDLPAGRSYAGGRLDLPLDPDLVRHLKGLAAKVGCSFFTVLLAGFKLLLRRLSGSKIQVIGMPAARQNTLGKTNLVGNCLAYVPIVSAVDDSVHLDDYLLSLRASLLEALDNSRYDFSALKADWPKPKDPRRTPFLPVCLNMSPKMGSDKLDFAGHQIHYEPNPRYFESFELFVNAVTGDGDSLVLQFQYNASLFKLEEIHRWQGILSATFAKMAEESRERLAVYLETEPHVLPAIDQNSAAVQIVTKLCWFPQLPATDLFASRKSRKDGFQLEALEAQNEAIRSGLRRLAKGNGGLSSIVQSVAPSDQRAVSRPRPGELGDVPLYFGPREELFGVCRVPGQRRAASAQSTGVLFCYPLGHEYFRSHWAFRLLSNFLLQRGVPVFKFDYYGTGDSLGEMDDADVARWVRDVHSAAAEFKTRAGISTLSLVGLRFGAVLAATAVEEGLPVEDLVLWDPVVGGSSHLAEIKRVHTDLVKSWTNLYPFPTEASLEIDPDEIVGIRFPKRLQQQIETTSLLNRSFASKGRVHVIVSEDKDAYQALTKEMGECPNCSPLRLIPDDGEWNNAALFERALLPSKILQAIATIVCAGEQK